MTKYRDACSCSAAVIRERMGLVRLGWLQLSILKDRCCSAVMLHSRAIHCYSDAVVEAGRYSCTVSQSRVLITVVICSAVMHGR
jgi:hypothetical protein